MAENRSHPRAPIELRIVYERINAFIADYTKDLSHGGVFIKTTEPMPLGTVFQFNVELPGGAEPLRLTGRVKWVRRGEYAEARGMGVGFVWSSEAERLDFERRVEDIITLALGPTVVDALKRDQEP